MSPRKRSKEPLIDDGPEVRDDSGGSGWRTGEKRILVLESSLQPSSPSDPSPEVISLRHPRTKTAASFLVAGKDEIREVVTYSEDNRCWFVDETVESNGRLYLATAVDPVLLVLPYLRSAERLVPLQHLLVDDAFPELHRLAGIPVLLRGLRHVADAKGSADLNVWKYNEALTLAYLERKVRRVAAALADAGVGVRGGATSSAFVKSLKEEVDRDQYLRFAHGMMADYLEEDLATLLKEHMRIPVEVVVVVKKRETVVMLEGDRKRARGGGEAEPIDDYSKNYKAAAIKAPALSAKQKALAKNAAGSKSITSFFTKR